jgi:hypothetical protein
VFYKIVFVVSIFHNRYGESVLIRFCVKMSKGILFCKLRMRELSNEIIKSQGEVMKIMEEGIIKLENNLCKREARILTKLKDSIRG